MDGVPSKGDRVQGAVGEGGAGGEGDRRMTEFDKQLEWAKSVGYDEPLMGEMHEELQALVLSWLKKLDTGKISTRTGVSMILSVLHTNIVYLSESYEEARENNRNQNH